MSDVKKAYSVEGKIYYRFNKNLYIKANSKYISNFSIENPLENLKYCNEKCSSYFGFNDCDTREKMIKKANEDIENYLLIEGELYRISFKPYYRIYTFGCNNNHGGTSLSICDREFDYYPNEKICYDAEEREEAIKEALLTATKRGDTKSLERIKETTEIIIY